MSQTIEHLEKVLGDLISNRARLVEQNSGMKVQLEVNEAQVDHFDTLIATVRSTLGDAAAIAKVDELIATPQNEYTGGHAPLGDAGAGAETAPAPAGFDGQGIPSQG